MKAKIAKTEIDPTTNEQRRENERVQKATLK